MKQVRSGKRAMRVTAASASTLIFCLVLLAVPGYGQSLTGRWTTVGRTLDNGEQLRSILELKQNGDVLTGTMETPWWPFSTTIKGTAAGTHFVIFVPWIPQRPFLVGDLMSGELHWTQDGGAFVATPVTPADEFPKLPYLDPPALHNVPPNGLAETPPMGWNSWNLFAEKIDDKTIRTMADAMVSSGMRDAGYVYMNIDDTWEGVRDAQGQPAIEPQVS